MILTYHKLRYVLLWVLLLCGVAPYHVSAQPRYIIADLGMLTGTNQSHGMAINANGQVTGYVIAKNGTEHAFRTTAKEPTQEAGVDLLGTEWKASAGLAINALGQVVGTCKVNDETRAFQTSFPDATDRKETDLGTLGGRSTWSCAINDRGQVAGGAKTIEGETHAFRTTPYGLINAPNTDLGTLGGHASFGWGMNNRGQVTGSSETLWGQTHAFRTSPMGTLRDPGADLGTFADSDYSVAYAINDRGQVTGFAKLRENVFHAFRTTATGSLSDGTATDLGTLGGSESWGKAINARGWVVGRSKLLDEIVYHAFLYTDRMIDLNTLLPPYSTWVLTSANGINNLGQIVGEGKINGETHAFLMTPVSTPLPSSTLTLTQEQRNTALISAIERDSATQVQFLLDHSADPNAQGKEFYRDDNPRLAPALILAMQREERIGDAIYINLDQTVVEHPLPWRDDPQRTAIVRTLLAHGADVNTREPWSGRTALILAVSNRYEGSALTLLEHGADIEAKDNDGFTALMLAANRPRAWKALLKRGADVNATNRDGSTPLLLAALREDTDLLKALLAKGAEANFRTNPETQFSSALETCLINGDVEAVRALLKYGADSLHQSESKTTLQVSIAVNHPAILKMLLAHGWRADLMDRSGETPLMQAALFGEVASVKLLLAAGADVNAGWKDRDTPLMIALRYLAADAVKLRATVKTLIASGADVNVRAKDGMTPLKLATQADKPDIVVLLKQAGAKE